MQIRQLLSQLNHGKNFIGIVSLLLILVVPGFLSANNASIQTQPSPEPTLTQTPIPTLTPTPTPENPLISASRIQELTPLRNWQAHASAVLGLSFSPDLTHLVSTGNDLDKGTSPIQLWNIRTAQASEINFEGTFPYQTVSPVHFSPDGQYIAASLGSGGTAIWNVDGTLAARIGQGGVDSTFADITPSSDGSQIVIVREDGLVGIWRVPPTLPPSDALASMGISPDSWKAHNFAELITAFQIDEPVRAVEFDPITGQTLILSHTGKLIIFTRGKLVTVAPDSHGASIEPFQGYTGSGIASRPQTNTIAYLDSAHTATIYDLTQGRSIARYDIEKPISCTLYSPDGQLLIITELTENSAIHVLDANTGTPLAVLETQSMISSCAFSPDGTLFATGNIKGEITLWAVK
jgi:WD40 repeat protein